MLCGLLMGANCSDLKLVYILQNKLKVCSSPHVQIFQSTQKNSPYLFIFFIRNFIPSTYRLKSFATKSIEREEKKLEQIHEEHAKNWYDFPALAKYTKRVPINIRTASRACMQFVLSVLYAVLERIPRKKKINKNNIHAKIHIVEIMFYRNKKKIITTIKKKIDSLPISTLISRSSLIIIWQARIREMLSNSSKWRLDGAETNKLRRQKNTVRVLWWKKKKSISII